MAGFHNETQWDIMGSTPISTCGSLPFEHLLFVRSQMLTLCREQRPPKTCRQEQPCTECALTWLQKPAMFSHQELETQEPQASKGGGKKPGKHACKVGQTLSGGLGRSFQYALSVRLLVCKSLLCSPIPWPVRNHRLKSNGLRKVVQQRKAEAKVPTRCDRNCAGFLGGDGGSLFNGCQRYLAHNSPQ